MDATNPHPATDQSLLARYSSTGCEDAFSELLRRHVNLVYSAALRQTLNNPASAQDVTQSVFIQLARQSQKLCRHPSLVGWLYTTTRRLAMTKARDDRRRQSREMESVRLHQTLPSHPTESEPDWLQLAPVLDAAMHELNESDRLALILRFFQNRELRVVGEAIGTTENTARMRIDRALQKLQRLLAKRGIHSSTSALSALLIAHSVTSAPTGFAASATTVVLATIATTTSIPFTSSLLNLMSSSKLVPALGSVLITGLSAALISEHHDKQILQSANADLSIKIQSQTTPAPTTPGFTQVSDDELAKLRAEHAELLKLRGELNPLRQQVLDLTAASKRLATPHPVQNNPIEPSPEAIEIEKTKGILRLNAMKQWMLAFTLHAHDHDNQLPDSFDKALKYTEDPGAEGGFPSSEIEIVWSGSLKQIQDPSKTIILREREPRPNIRGTGLVRAYGFADGHSEIKLQADGDFTRWEQERSPKPE